MNGGIEMDQRKLPNSGMVSSVLLADGNHYGAAVSDI
jgi:hypothetical protein